MLVRFLSALDDDLLGLLERAVGVARDHLVGADAVAQRVEHVAATMRLTMAQKNVGLISRPHSSPVAC